MTLTSFVRDAKLLEQSELQKVRLLSFYHRQASGLAQFSMADVAQWFDELGLSTPNPTRLRNNIRKSKIFIRGALPNTFRLHAKEIDTLESEHGLQVDRSEEIHATDSVLPESLVSGTRGFIETLTKQINASWEQNIFDGCAVLMRRLIEVLLILAFQANGVEDRIKDSNGDLRNLNQIIAEARGNQALDLSKTTKSSLDGFRTLGNFSAHQIYYNAKRADVQKELPNFRVAVEELLYKSGLKS